jgi:hypothetical protein
MVTAVGRPEGGQRQPILIGAHIHSVGQQIQNYRIRLIQVQSINLALELLNFSLLGLKPGVASVIIAAGRYSAVLYRWDNIKIIRPPLFFSTGVAIPHSRLGKRLIFTP